MRPEPLLFIFLCYSHFLLAQTDSLQHKDTLKTYTTAQVHGEPPHIDGDLSDPAWQQVEWGGGDFVQTQPNPGKAPTVQTYFKILYDQKNLYIGIKNLDPEPEKIVRRMSRRDGFEGDWVEVNIDSYYDKRTAFSFTPSASGVKGDQYCSNNGENWDNGWEPIWYLQTSINEEGWVAEMRIPLSQLRFGVKDEHVWGLQFSRRFFRKQEMSTWQYIPPDAAGWVHLFGEMKGIKGIKPQKQLEIQPYVVAQTETFEKEEGNPYLTGNTSSASLGLDAKIGITSDITLDLTVNPDFGQVEADPSQVNLSAFELFFQERRPFFLEGSNTLNFPLSQINSNTLFYSRRIGRPPQGWVDTDEGGADNVSEYVKPNGRTNILGAAKLTGKNKKGFSWGVLESVTAREYAEIDSLGHTRKQEIEPLTNYFVARGQQDINKGNSILGGMFTATNRKFDDARLRWLHESAYSGGIDFLHHWKKREYYVSGRGVMSHVKGSKEAIAETQLSSERYFQRPDNHHTEFDPERKSLTGTGGQVMIGKKSGTILSDIGVMWQSPELDLNDLGFMSQTDMITQWFWMQYRVLQPKGITRWQRYNINQWRDYDFGLRNLGYGYNVNGHVEFKNFWQSGGGVSYLMRSASNADLRGGPTLQYPGNLYCWIYTGTDARKKLHVFLNIEQGFGFENYLRNSNISLELTYKPVNALNVSVSPSLGFNNNAMQYVATGSVNSEPRFIVAEIDQTIARVVFRATYMITPNLSVQYYGQPFGTSGKYGDYKIITDAGASSYNERFAQIPFGALSQDQNGFLVDEDNDGITDYGFSKPDFNFGQFRSNMVIRWEYIPGSTFFLVWTRERNGAFYDSDPEHDNYSFDFNEKGHNIFLLKFTYRFVL